MAREPRPQPGSCHCIVSYGGGLARHSSAACAPCETLLCHACSSTFLPGSSAFLTGEMCLLAGVGMAGTGEGKKEEADYKRLHSFPLIRVRVERHNVPWVQDKSKAGLR